MLSYKKLTCEEIIKMEQTLEEDILILLKNGKYPPEISSLVLTLLAYDTTKQIGLSKDRIMIMIQNTLEDLIKE
jgi:hypothetical protein